MSGAPDSTLADPQQIITDLQRQLAECRAERDGALAERDNAQRRLAERTAERDEAWEQQTASAEVLQVINSSPGDLTPVFDALLEKAMQLCEATFGGLTSFDGERFHTLALRGLPTEAVEAFREPWVAGPGAYHENLVRGEPLVHTDFGVADPARRAHPQSRAIMEMGKARTGLIIALCKDERLLGSLFFYRQEIRPFSDKQIALLQNFAAQAVIAMENARLITETREALEQQTATAEVLQVINSSPGDLTPVFDAILEKAMQLCEAAFGVFWTFEGEVGQVAALRGVPPAFAEFLTRGPHRETSSTANSRLRRGENIVQIADSKDDDAYRSGEPVRRAMVVLGGARTMLAVPLRKDGTLLGSFIIYRQEVRPFTDKQIALLQNFAAQAVIAMENARLLTETREALEQQTATAEVLQVINSSPGDLAPVFDAILEKAHTLCGAEFGSLFLYDGEHFRAIASHGVPEVLASRLREGIGANESRSSQQLIAGAPFAHIHDSALEEGAVYRGMDMVSSHRTLLSVPLRKHDALLGMIVAGRLEVRPFTDKQIALLQNFAEQAVIAMENARLLTETREALEQQTATAEVLGVINSSPGDLMPVFDAMLDKAIRLCDTAFGIMQTYDGEAFPTVALRGAPPALVEVFRERELFKPTPGTIAARIAAGETVIRVTDLREDPAYVAGARPARALVELGAARSFVCIALRKDNALLGALTAYRTEIRPFTDKQIALLQNFAAQAVIAMENARLLAETREALEQQTATAEVLQVINSSPGDLAPVFDAMLERAIRLCEATYGHMFTYDGELFHLAAISGPPCYVEWSSQLGPVRSGPSAPLGRISRGERMVHVTDIQEEEVYHTSPGFREQADRRGVRSQITIALLKDDVLLGAMVVYRQEVRPFTDKQIALLENFAAQAVIAMENARLLTETREALEQQTATAEVLQVINSSPGDLAPVFDAILEKAHTLCGAPLGSLVLWDGEQLYAVATRGYPQEYDALARQGFSLTPSISRLLSGEPFVQRSDFATAEAPDRDHPMRRAAFEIAGIRTVLWVPLRKDETVLGYISAQRQEVRPFTDKQIALLQNFAAQAVIAMENARLLDEIRQAQQELRVTFDNMVDGVAMFGEALRLAAWNRNFQELLQLPDEFLAQRPDLDTYIRYLVERGEFSETDPETQIARLRERIGDHYSFERIRPDGTVIEVRHNPMPGGGIVLIYSDITERKRSEAKIRAARDTAEAAYRDLKAAQASLIQAEKMASLGQLTAGIAHEIKNPLNFVNNFAGLSVELLDELKETAAPAISALDDEKRAEIDDTIEMLSGNLDKIAEHGRRADNIVTSMLEHSRGSSGERRSVDLNALIEEALNLAYHGGRAQDQSFNITLERDYADTITPIELVPQDISRVCLNLFGNGFYAATKRQKEASDTNFKPVLKVSTRDLGEAVEIRVRDNGIGIPPEIRDRLFQPFFTTKPTGEGTGLGLSISYDIVTQQHGGTISVESEPGAFTEFTVRLPRH